jgi:hypothetical protein
MDKNKKSASAPKKAGVFVIKSTKTMDESEPTAAEKARMRQRMREEEMDKGTDRGAAQYEGPDFPVPVRKAKGGMVTKGNGCAIRGVKKYKSY